MQTGLVLVLYHKQPVTASHHLEQQHNSVTTNQIILMQLKHTPSRLNENPGTCSILFAISNCSPFKLTLTIKYENHCIERKNREYSGNPMKLLSEALKKIYILFFPLN